MTTFPLESFLGDLKFLINTDSGSADIEGNLQVASFFKERFEKAGLETVLHRVGSLGRPVVTARTQGSASYDYFFSGHIDTVFPSGTVSERPFRREGNFVYGPGTVDMKAGGTSDANRLACLGLPILDGCGPGGGFPHSEKEFLNITTVPARFDQLIEIIKKLSASPN